MNEVKVRFAPSPTGPLHIGGARSALFNWLFARRYGGKLVLRIEDTDLERSSRESEENILAALRWLGLHWDEGAELGGSAGPYRQTERLEIYRQYAAQLLANGQAYYCYCSEEELAQQREKQLAAGEMVCYDGRCRDLDPAVRKQLESEGRRPVVRFKVPVQQTIVLQDLVRGEVSFDCAGLGDYIIVKSDGIPTYNYAVAVDDHLMGITHVIRAEEHLSNTPRQVLIYEALGFPLPFFAHVSLILGQDRAKMSKRHGATSIEQYQELGYLPEALVNFLALLGWSSGTEEEVLTLEQLSRQFSLERVVKSPAVFDLEKLNWLNGYYLKQTPLERLLELAVPFLQRYGYLPAVPDEDDLRKARLVMAAIRDYLDYLAQVEQHAALFYTRPAQPEADARKVLAGAEVPQLFRAVCGKLAALDADLDEAQAKTLLKQLPRELELPGKKVYLPLRAGLTGKTKGPELYQLLPALGNAEAAARLEASLKATSEK